MGRIWPAAIAAMLGGSGLGCATLEPTNAGAFCAVLEREVAHAVTPSLAIAAVAGDELVFLDAKGVADPITGRPATVDTVYMFFSLTKLFTATAVMTLVDAGKIDLDQPVRRYLPELALENRYETPLTTRHLLDHSSGLANPAAWSWARPHDQPRPTLADFLDAILAEHGRLEAEPGTRDEYNNLAYLVLGRLIEVVSGESYEDYVRTHLLEPLDMKRTDFVYRDDMIDHAAIGVVKRNSVYHRLFRRVAPATLFGPTAGPWATARLYVVDGAPYGGLVGTAGDLARFVAMHLSNGRHEGRQILSPRSVAAMQELQHTSAGKLLDHSLGWHTDVIAGERYYNHMGRGGGFRPAVHVYPELGFGIIVLSNGTAYDPRSVVRRVPVAGKFSGRCPD